MPPMGIRVPAEGFIRSVRVPGVRPGDSQGAAKTKYGNVVLADNGGNWFVSGSPDRALVGRDLQALKKVKGSDFEVVLIGNVIAKVAPEAARSSRSCFDNTRPISYHTVGMNVRPTEWVRESPREPRRSAS